MNLEVVYSSFSSRTHSYIQQLLKLSVIWFSYTLKKGLFVICFSYYRKEGYLPIIARDFMYDESFKP